MCLGGQVSLAEGPSHTQPIWLHMQSHILPPFLQHLFLPVHHRLFLLGPPSHSTHVLFCLQCPVKRVKSLGPGTGDGSTSGSCALRSQLNKDQGSNHYSRPGPGAGYSLIGSEQTPLALNIRYQVLTSNPQGSPVKVTLPQALQGLILETAPPELHHPDPH